MMWAHMDGKLVFKNAVERMIARRCMQACWEQAASRATGHRPLRASTRRTCASTSTSQQQLGTPDEKLVHNIQRYGNTTAATIPILLAEAERERPARARDEGRVVAFGSGFTWGAAIIDW